VLCHVAADAAGTEKNQLTVKQTRRMIRER